MKKLLAQTNVVLVTRLIATALLLSAVGSCSDRQMPTALEANKSSNKQIAPVIDWYSCWKYESDTEWRECNYTGTTGENNGPSWVDFTDPYYYTSLQQVAVTSNPYAVEPQPHAYLPDMSDQDTISRYIPICSEPQDDPGYAAYCAGQDPANFAATGDRQRYNAIIRALNAMKAIGPPCDAIANDVLQVLGAHHLRVYNVSLDPAHTGFKDGGWGSPGAGGAGAILLDSRWTDDWFDNMKYGIHWVTINGVATQVKMDLQWVLAHEGDHLRGAKPWHIDDGSKPYLTPNSIYCGGLGS